MGSRKLTGRAPRKRGGKAKKRGLSDEQVPVLIARDRHGTTHCAVLPDLSADSFKTALSPHIAPDAVLVTDGRAAYGVLAKNDDLTHLSLVASAGERVLGRYHIQNVNAYISRLKKWMHRFNGVSTRYLSSYLAWHQMIDRIGPALTPHRHMGEAIGYATT